MELISATKEQEIMNLNYLNLKLQRELQLKQHDNKEVMTEVNMKDLEFVQQAGKIMKSKITAAEEFLKSLQIV